jgi:hypothetical protein
MKKLNQVAALFATVALAGSAHCAGAMPSGHPLPLLVVATAQLLLLLQHLLRLQHLRQQLLLLQRQLLRALLLPQHLLQPQLLSRLLLPR